jgi:hypothetical protein
MTKETTETKKSVTAFWTALRAMKESIRESA